MKKGNEKVFVVILLAASAVILGGLVIPSPLCPQEKIEAPGTSEIITQRAMELVENMIKGEFEVATKHFDETMKKAAPPEFLQKIWEQLQAQVGRFQEIKGSRVETSAAYDFVLVVCQFEKQMLDARVVFNKAGEIAGLNFVPHLEIKESPPPPYARPELFREQEVEIKTDEWVLPGTLTIPEGPGPFPAVVLVHGSGPNDRDETIGPNKPFRDLLGA